MKTKPLTLLLSLTFLVLFSGSSVVFGDDLQDGRDAYHRKDYKTAYKLVAPLAEQGVADAQNVLGVMYNLGRGVPQDYKEAVRLYRLSAEQGNAEAQLNLGFMYETGQGVPQDRLLAHMWFNIAGSSGDEDAIEKRNVVEEKITPSQIDKE